MKFYFVTALVSLISVAILGAVERPTDEQIATALATRLSFDPLVPDGVEVAVAGGVAKLTGSVPTLLAKDQATAIALSTRSIISVVNRVSVAADERPDVELVADVLAALEEEPATEPLEVVAEVRKGNVVLKGTVNSLAEGRLAERAARSVRGVRSIDSEIRVDYQGERKDAEILEDVRRALATDVWITAGLIEASIGSGVIKLRGVVGSASERARAIARAEVRGVTAVDAESLVTDPFVSNPSQKAQAEYPQWDREAIEAAIEAGFANDPRIGTSNLKVDVREDFTVLLSGRVKDGRAKAAASAVAQDTFGVISVRNYLKISPESPVPDEQIVARAQAAFKRNPYLFGRSDVKVTSEGGNVTLAGSVEFPFEAEMAEDLILGLKGVYAVENQLKVDRVLNSYRPHLAIDRSGANLGLRYLRREEKLDQAAIAKEVVAALEWQPEVDISNIRVRVDGRMVVLEGQVGSVREATAASEVVRVRAALEVDNRLEIK